MRPVHDDFLLPIEYLKPWQHDHLEKICCNWGKFFLPNEDNPHIETLKPVLRPFWFFFVALCHVLQEGENELTARDCYWLGLIDEVIGDTDLSNLRQIVEFAPTADEFERG